MKPDIIAFLTSIGEYHRFRHQIIVKFHKINVEFVIDIKYNKYNEPYLTLNGYVIDEHVLYDTIDKLYDLHTRLEADTNE